jgi:desulfoferrodoxin (superoxide reductase-like protein)
MNRVRRTTTSDAIDLRQFKCSSGLWYEQEVEELVQGLLADQVELGFSAWVIEDDQNELVAVAVHVGQQHPDNPEIMITYIALLATRVDSRNNQLDGLRLSQLLKAVFEDILLNLERGPHVYQMVAEENTRMRSFLERSGFQVAPVPSDYRYLYYSTRIVPENSSAQSPIGDKRVI